MSTQKKSIDEIWKELNAPKPGRSGNIGAVLGGATNMPGVTTISRVLPGPHAAGSSPMPAGAMEATRPSPSLTSHYDPSRAGVTAEALQVYLSTIQRTINCLSDPDRSTRKQAISALLSRLTPQAAASGGGGGGAPDPAMLQALICGPLLHPVTALLHDLGEGARLVAVELMQRAATAVPDFSAALPVLLPELLKRMGHAPVVEPAEEVRLMLAGLVSAIVQG